jgi:protein TonB
MEGVVILQVDIDATGAVKKVDLVQGLGYGCDEAAIDALWRTTFRPALSGDLPVPVHGLRIPYRFELSEINAP